jgi:hypothetical protein
VWIGYKSLTQFFFAIESCPHLRPAHEKTLISGEAIDNGRVFSVQGQLVSSVRDAEATKIADIFSQC